METVSANGQATNYTYDKRGNRTAVTYPGGIKEEYTYDKAGNRLSEEETYTSAQSSDSSSSKSSSSSSSSSKSGSSSSSSSSKGNSSGTGMSDTTYNETVSQINALVKSGTITQAMAGQAIDNIHQNAVNGRSIDDSGAVRISSRSRRSSSATEAAQSVKNIESVKRAYEGGYITWEEYISNVNLNFSNIEEADAKKQALSILNVDAINIIFRETGEISGNGGMKLTDSPEGGMVLSILWLLLMM